MPPRIGVNSPVSIPMNANTREYMAEILIPDLTTMSVSGMIKVQIIRRGDTDAYAGDVRVSSYDMHVLRNSLGSRTEGAK